MDYEGCELQVKRNSHHVRTAECHRSLGRGRNGEGHASAKKVHINWKITEGFITYSLSSLFDSRCML